MREARAGPAGPLCSLHPWGLRGGRCWALSLSSWPGRASGGDLEVGARAKAGDGVTGPGPPARPWTPQEGGGRVASSSLSRGLGGLPSGHVPPVAALPPTELLLSEIVPHCRPVKLYCGKHSRERVDRVWLQLCHRFYARGPGLGRGSPRRRPRPFGSSQLLWLSLRPVPGLHPDAATSPRSSGSSRGVLFGAPSGLWACSRAPSVGGARKYLLRPRSHPCAPPPRPPPHPRGACVPFQSRAIGMLLGRAPGGLGRASFLLLLLLLISERKAEAEGEEDP